MPNYLYNGVELPAIPAEVMSNPYVYIFESVEGSTYLAYGFDTKPTTVSVTTFGNSVDKLRAESGTYASACWYSTTPDEWTGIEANKSPSDAALGYMQQNLSDVIWANFDVYLSNGELFLAASEPIPVTEPESFDLDSWLIGFAMGLANEPLPLGIVPVYENWPIEFRTDALGNNEYFMLEDFPCVKVSSLIADPAELKKMGEWRDGDVDTATPYYYDIDNIDPNYPNVRMAGATFFVLDTTEIGGQTVNPGVYYIPIVVDPDGVDTVTIGYLPYRYLYGAANLPKLPEWDKETYPYAIIHSTGLYNDVVHYAYFCQYPFVYDGSSKVGMAEEGMYQEWVFDHGENNGEWKYTGSGTSHVNQQRSNVVWANHDILESDGTTVNIAASEPIPLYATPVAYLYNDVQLPALPEWDKETYPYAVISVSKPTMIKKYYTAMLKCFHVISAGTGGVMNDSSDVGFLTYTITWDDGTEAPTDTWGAVTVNEPSATSSTAFSYIKWTNTDITASDGSWSMAASEPVPVYDTTTTTTEQEVSE